MKMSDKLASIRYNKRVIIIHKGGGIVISAKTIVHGAGGIHLRPAGSLAEAGIRYSCRIWLARGSRQVNGKSLLSILSLGIQDGAEVEVQCDGADEQEALETYLKILSGQS